jgi:hypothetical protein
MKYGESAFCIFYLVTAVTIGLLILKKAGNRGERWMGLAVLILGCGDAFHLVPRILNYFAAGDFTAALGIGKLVTSITMTLFYVLLYYVGCEYFNVKKSSRILDAVYVFAAIRIIICLLPQNRWLSNDSDMLWGILRNIPFVILGLLVINLFFAHRTKYHPFRNIWLWILLSFAFYIPVAVFAGVRPVLGMLMLPKTICYLVMIFTFYKTSNID